MCWLPKIGKNRRPPSLPVYTANSRTDQKAGSVSDATREFQQKKFRANPVVLKARTLQWVQQNHAPPVMKK
jgi:hypothetical protein